MELFKRNLDALDGIQVLQTCERRFSYKRVRAGGGDDDLLDPIWGDDINLGADDDDNDFSDDDDDVNLEVKPYQPYKRSSPSSSPVRSPRAKWATQRTQIQRRPLPTSPKSSSLGSSISKTDALLVGLVGWGLMGGYLYRRTERMRKAQEKLIKACAKLDTEQKN